MERITIILFAVLLGISHSVLSQELTLNWATQIACQNSMKVNDVAIDQEGNIYVTGYFLDEIDADPSTSTYNLTSGNLSDVLVAKYSPSSELIWAKQFTSDGENRGNSIVCDTSGNIYVGGYVTDTTNFDPDSTNYSFNAELNSDAFVAKMDEDGSLIWVNHFTGSGLNSVRSLSYADGRIIMAGHYSHEVDFNPNGTPLTANSGNDFAGFAGCVNENGDIMWITPFEGDDDLFASGCTIDPIGNSIIVGSFKGTTSFDTAGTLSTYTSNGGTDAYALHLDTAGTLQWIKHYGGTGDDFANKVAADANGWFGIIGYFESSVDFDPGPGTYVDTSNGGVDSYVLKLDSQGLFEWNYPFGGNSHDLAQNLTTDSLGNFYCTGQFRGSVDFDAGPNTFTLHGGISNVFVSIIGSSGSFIHAIEFGGSGSTYDIGLSITLGNDHNIVTVGSFDGTADFDPSDSTYNLTVTENGDGFIQNLNLCNTYNSLEMSACDETVSPSGNHVWSMSGTYTDTVPNAWGCDSILLIEVTIYPSTNDTVSLESCDSVMLPNNSVVTSSGFYDINYNSSLGCDSTITFDVTINMAQETILSEDACVYYIAPNNGDTLYESTVLRDTLTSSSGCDSIIVTNVNVSEIDNTITLNPQGTGAIAQELNCSYQWLNCDSNFGAISSSTQQYYVDFSGANVAVEITKNGCIDTSECVSFKGVGMNAESKHSTKVYPNPSSGSYVIKGLSSKEVKGFKVYDLLGEPVEHTYYDSRSGIHFTINGPSGYYILEFEQLSQPIRKRILKL